MSSIKKVFLFPDAPKESVGAAAETLRDTVNYVGVLGAERATLPYLHAPLDAELAARLLQPLSSPDTEYVVALRHDHAPKEMLRYLQTRQLAFATKQEVVVYPSSLIFLAALGKKVRSPKHYVIYRTTNLDDVQWTIARYGSLDRVRVFITRSSVASQVAVTLAQPTEQIDYNLLLDLCEYHALFDYDWEYFYVVTRKPHIDHMLSWFRRACHALNVETETQLDAKISANLRGRLERLMGISLFRPLAVS